VYASLARHHLTGVPLTGQDAQPDGLGRILLHEQGMTVFKNVKLEADSAAQVAYDWVAGRPLPPNYTTNCGAGCAQATGRHVPAALFKPQAITIRNVAAPVLAGYVTWHDICTSIAKPVKPFCGLPH
jgi:D-xylose transport system substrate-binding protein